MKYNIPAGAGVVVLAVVEVLVEVGCVVTVEVDVLVEVG